MLPNHCNLASELFPAHAGMDRREVLRVEADENCSPHTRGWTELADLLLTWEAPVPRTRGDGPISEQDRQEEENCSPHTRGWTFTTPLDSWRDLLFPAHAGMDR